MTNKIPNQTIIVPRLSLALCLHCPRPSVACCCISLAAAPPSFLTNRNLKHIQDSVLQSVKIFSALAIQTFFLLLDLQIESVLCK